MPDPTDIAKYVAAEAKDLSHLNVVQEMMAGKSGVTEFYSPFVKENMVVGFTSVPEIGWGIMVPQPKSEVEEQVSPEEIEDGKTINKIDLKNGTE